MPGMESEKRFQQAVVEYAHLMGWLVYHTHDSRRSAPGFPDLTLVRDGRLVFAELKGANGRLRPEQRQWLDALQAADAEIRIWRPTDWNDVIETLERRQFTRGQPQTVNEHAA